MSKFAYPVRSTDEAIKEAQVTGIAQRFERGETRGIVEIEESGDIVISEWDKALDTAASEPT